MLRQQPVNEIKGNKNDAGDDTNHMQEKLYKYIIYIDTDRIYILI